jgi:hypothetical protein
MKKALSIFALLTIIVLVSCVPDKPKMALLKQHPKNWRYFDNGTGKPVYLVSSHTWMADLTSPGWPQGDWNGNKLNKYLDFIQYWNLNFIRTWMWEHDAGSDGIWMKNVQGKFDLTQLNQAYFDRLYTFVREAEKRHIYVSVMLFQGFSGALSYQEDNFFNWTLHPMNAKNNINGIDGDPAGKGYGIEIHNVENKAILPYWEVYVKKMVDTFNDCNNVIWEMGNEDPYPPFSKHFIDVIRSYEKNMPKQHLVYYSAGSFTGNEAIYSSNADVYGPQADDYEWGTIKNVYFNNPPVVSHQKPEILDADHVGNITSPKTFMPIDQRNWTWKSFLRGYHVLFMDCYDSHPKYTGGSNLTQADHPIAGVTTSPLWDPQRKSLGNTLQFASKMKYLASTEPTADTILCSTGYCMYLSGKEYIAYQPDASGSITLDLAKGTYKVETFDTEDSSSETAKINGWDGGKRTFEKPSHVSQDWVLYLVR